MGLAGGYTGSLHNLFGKGFSGFKSGSLLGWTKHRKTSFLQHIDDTGGEYAFRLDDDQVRLSLFTKLNQLMVYRDVNRVVGNFYGNTGVSGRAAHLRNQWIGTKGLHKCMFAATWA